MNKKIILLGILLGLMLLGSLMLCPPFVQYLQSQQIIDENSLTMLVDHLVMIKNTTSEFFKESITW